MSDSPYIGEIFILGFNFNPQNMLLCNGQLLNISTYTALFSILGTTYGGNGSTNFGLPDLRGRAANGMGQGPGLANYNLGQISGVENVTLATTQLASHNHLVNSNNGAGSLDTPVNNYFAVPIGPDKDPAMYNAATSGTTPAMNAAATGLTGVGGGHNNVMPYLVLNFSIATVGIYPSRN